MEEGDEFIRIKRDPPVPLHSGDTGGESRAGGGRDRKTTLQQQEAGVLHVRAAKETDRDTT